jgi:uncharacterized membrane protein YfcA
MEFDLYILLAGLSALLIGMAKGGLPMVGMMSVPLLSMVMSPVKAAVLLLPLFVLTDVVAVWLYRKHQSVDNLKILVPAGVLGVLLGWLTAAFISELALKLLIGLVGVGFCLQIWFKRVALELPVPASRPKGLFWGALAGFTSFISHSGGPPFQVFMLPQKLSKTEFAGTATIFFAIVNLAKIAPYQQLMPYSLDDLKKVAVLIPLALMGTFLGAYLTRRLNDVWFYKLVQVSLFLVSLKLMTDALMDYWSVYVPSINQ